ncbi:MAG: YeeE/YedE thiosulfate transporter family protein [Actinomycetota bacterium]|nr:YeeE/YedE thiosulfate transporter family protein [Actinomycetota bacterium]
MQLQLLLASVLPDRAPWYVVGPLLGALTVSFFVVMNQPLGASGAYTQTLNYLTKSGYRTMWRVWYFVGMALGGLVVTQFLQSNPGIRSGFDSFRSAAPLGLIIPVIFIGAVMIGYGARIAGGCTSGHGICGNAQRSKASVVATVSFMSAAILSTGVIRLISGGEL